MLRVVPCTIGEAKAFVEQHHRHRKAPRSGLFAVAVADVERVRGVAIVGRPKSRVLDADDFTAEVTRVSVTVPIAGTAARRSTPRSRHSIVRSSPRPPATNVDATRPAAQPVSRSAMAADERRPASEMSPSRTTSRRLRSSISTRPIS